MKTVDRAGWVPDGATSSPGPATSATPDQPAETTYRLSRESKRVFIGLMLGMLVASISQTIVGPAMPRIVADLGGMDHYSWVATAAMLVSAITVPIVGKLSDIHGRRPFYLGGLVAFMIGSIICGVAPNFFTLVLGRAVQGLGMGTLMPLSQTIIGDIIPPRQRGKYQGLMGAVFGVTSVAGPLVGGFVTDHWGWRLLFFISIPVGLLATLVISKFLHVPHEPRTEPMDKWGIATLAVTLAAMLLALSWGGTSYAWDSTLILSLFAVGTVALIAFLAIERRAVAPVLPLRLFKSRVFTAANIAAFGLAMVMFGAIIYIPVYAQGVLGINATNSGLILTPMMLGFIVFGILTGLVITKTGKYKALMVGGVVVIAVALWLLTRLHHQSTPLQLTTAMVVLGVGMGMLMQQLTLVVQNNADQSDMGVATASTQFFRNVGSTVGIAVFGTVMTSGLGEAISSHLPANLPAHAVDKGLNPSAVLNPDTLASLPPAVVSAVRQGLAERLHEVFVLGLPIIAVVFVAVCLIRVETLRTTLNEQPVKANESVKVPT